MDRWQYKYSFFSGILLIFSFFSKESIKRSSVELSLLIIVFPYILIVLYHIGLLIGYLKYAKLNEKKYLEYTSYSVIVSFSLLILLELFSIIFTINNDRLITVLEYFTGISFILFSITLFMRKKIYGKSTLLPGFFSFVFGMSIIAPNSEFVSIIEVFTLLASFTTLTYLINKNPDKMKKKKLEPKFLKKRF